MNRERLPACIALLTGMSCAQILLAPSRTAVARSAKSGSATVLLGRIQPPPVTRSLDANVASAATGVSNVYETAPGANISCRLGGIIAKVSQARCFGDRL